MLPAGDQQKIKTGQDDDSADNKADHEEEIRSAGAGYFLHRPPQPAEKKGSEQHAG